MKKKYLAAAFVGGLTALAVETVVHVYFDIMYTGKLPKSFLMRYGDKKTHSTMSDLDVLEDESNEWIDSKDVEEIDYKNQRGQNLKGYLLPAENESKRFVVFAHGYRSSHRGNPAPFAQYYHEKGFNFFSMDHVASGSSEGEYIGFDYYESEDTMEWIEYLISRFGEDIEILLHGVSMGGATVCKMSDKVPAQVKLIVSDCAFTSAEDEFKTVAGDYGLGMFAPALYKTYNVMNKKFNGFDLAETDVRESVKNAKAPMLFVHGGADGFVPTKFVYELYDICSTEKDLLVVEGAGHAAAISKDGEMYKAKLDEFISKYF